MSLLNPSFIIVARKELIFRKERGECLSHIFTKRELRNLLKIGDDLGECALELLVKLLGEDLLVVAASGSELVLDEVVVKILDFVGSNDDWVGFKVSGGLSGDLNQVLELCFVFKKSYRNITSCVTRWSLESVKIPFFIGDDDEDLSSVA